MLRRVNGMAPVPDLVPSLAHLPKIREFFDKEYARHDRYWWRGENRYSTNPQHHTGFNATWLAEAARRGPGRALDLGTGEGADAIKLAKLGYQVDAIDLSAVACEKTARFARAEGVHVTVRNEAIETAPLRRAAYDLVLMNGCLHYVRDKVKVLRRILAASASETMHVVTIFSTATPIPAEHSIIPVFPKDEGGVIERFYRDWRMLLRSYERHRDERSHPGFGPHIHSHVKLIVARDHETEGL